MPHYHPLCSRDHPKNALKPLAVAIEAFREPPEPHYSVSAAHILWRPGIVSALTPDPVADLRIDPLQAILDIGLKKATMDEHRVADYQDGGQISQEPPRDGAVRAERGEAGSDAVPKLPLDAGEGLGDAEEGVLGLLEPATAALNGEASPVPAGPAGELLQALRRDEAKVAGHVHDLVIAEDGEERAALRGGGDAEATEEVEEAELVAAAIQDVAELDGEGGASGPGGGAGAGAGAVGGRQEAGEAEGGEGLGEVAVEVADGDEAGWGGEEDRKSTRLNSSHAD